MTTLKRNAIIMAAGTSSRFVPLSAEHPKGLLNVKGEILIERQIRQLHEAGITDITLVVGYKAEDFAYLREKYGVGIVLNDEYEKYNNTSSLIRVLDKLGNTFICSSDNYFPKNVFTDRASESYYSALYATGETQEYCIDVDTDDNITSIKAEDKIRGIWSAMYIFHPISVNSSLHCLEKSMRTRQPDMVIGRMSISALSIVFPK